jgi:glutaredoxin 3
MAAVTLYTTRYCPYCIRAKQLLDRKAVSYREIGVDGQPELRRKMVALSGRHTVPQIWLGARHIGGCDELYELERRGELDDALRAAAAEDTDSSATHG